MSRFELFHLNSLHLFQVVVALGVQHAVDDQVGRVLFHRLALFACLALQHVAYTG